ncbi:uncharacterized protein L199_008702 [Kwoniella botswanensis]|uniref:uncharacterized protein n=1 Tax=Kwoniella botswanensis TaxID=1268659 RepID=UPI00315DBF23
MPVQSDASLPAREPIPQLQSSSIPDPLDIYKRELANAKEFKALRILQSLQDRLHNKQSAAAPTTTNSKQTVKPPPFVACTLCRQCKAKCVISDPASGQCDRCKACKCQCVFEGHKRGRKSQESTLDKSPSQPEPSRTLHIPPMEIDSDEDEDGDMSSPNTQPSQSAAHHPLQLIAGSSRPLSLKNLLNPSTSGGQERSTKGLSADKSKGDIVSRGVISLEMAQKLFDLVASYSQRFSLPPLAS